MSRAEFFDNPLAVEELAQAHGAAAYFIFPVYCNDYGKKQLRKSVHATHPKEIDMFAALLEATTEPQAEQRESHREGKTSRLRFFQRSPRKDSRSSDTHAPCPITLGVGGSCRSPLRHGVRQTR